MQNPYFQALGLDLSHYHRGTLNITSLRTGIRARAAPDFPRSKMASHRTRGDFSFFDVRLIRPGALPSEGLIYFPHPDTKPKHFQQPDVLELLLPFVNGLSYSTEIRLEVPTEQMLIEPS